MIATIDGMSASGHTDPVRRARPIPSTTAPTRYAMEWPTPSIPTVAAPWNERPPPTITATPTTPATKATSAGVRLSPSA